jgi:hypothetical protein
MSRIAGVHDRPELRRQDQPARTGDQHFHRGPQLPIQPEQSRRGAMRGATGLPAG